MAVLIATTTGVLFKVHKKGSPVLWTHENSHAAICFKNPHQALMIASVIESHYLTHKEWPNGSDFSFKKQVIPTILGVQETTYDEMKNLCGLWDLKLIVMEDVIYNGKEKYTFHGHTEIFSIASGDRVRHLNSLLWDPSI